MKKTLKSILLVMIMTVSVLALTGCGKDKLVATKEIDDESMFGKHTETVEITFKNDKAEKLTFTYEFENEDKAKAIASLYALAGDELKGVETEQKGKKFIMTMDAKQYIEQSGEEVDDSELTKDALRKSLEEDGYTVK